LATALVAIVADLKPFLLSARDFSAWIGLLPKQKWSGGKDKLGNISKRINVQKLTIDVRSR
jgi:transposase